MVLKIVLRVQTATFLFPLQGSHGYISMFTASLDNSRISLYIGDNKITPNNDGLNGGWLKAFAETGHFCKTNWTPRTKTIPYSISRRARSMLQIICLVELDKFLGFFVRAHKSMTIVVIYLSYITTMIQ